MGFSEGYFREDGLPLLDEPEPDLAAWLLEQIAADEAEVQGHLGRSVALRLAECDAKRRIIADCQQVLADQGWEYDDAPNLADRTLCLLALPYADRPGYRESWRP